MARDVSSLFARADRLRTGRGFTQADVERVLARKRVWRPCTDAHDWRLVPGNGGHRCAVVTCRVYSNHGDHPTTCSACQGPTCTTDGRCPTCGGVFP